MAYPIYSAKVEIISLLDHALTKLKYKYEINLERPSENLGDFAFPCFSLAPIAKKSPNDISKEISEKIGKTKWIEKIESKGGYVNFFLNIEKMNKEILKSIFEKKAKSPKFSDGLSKFISHLYFSLVKARSNNEIISAFALYIG